jgi:hypothetical protein
MVVSFCTLGWLQGKLEEMSLGSHEHVGKLDTDNIGSLRLDTFFQDKSSTMDDSDDFPYHTKLDLDTCYKPHSDPEGGAGEWRWIHLITIPRPIPRTLLATCMHDQSSPYIQSDKQSTDSRLGQYKSRGADRHPLIPSSQVLLFSKHRPGSLITRRSSDTEANVTYGDAIIYKAPGTTRFMFQNVKAWLSTKPATITTTFSHLWRHTPSTYLAWQKQTHDGNILTFKPGSNSASNAATHWQSSLRFTNKTSGSVRRERPFKPGNLFKLSEEMSLNKSSCN